MPCGSKDSSNHDKNATNGHCAFEDLDHSVIQQPLNLGVTNIKQILKCIQSGSKEIKDLILNECNIIYECKVCVGLFRSLANFVYHKRCYCKKHRCEDMVLFENFDEEETIIVQPEPPKTNPEEMNKDTSKMADSTVDVAQEANPSASKDIKSIPEAPASTKEKNAVSGKAKNKPPEPSPMISRRTRDKNAQNPVSSSSANRAASKTNIPTEPLSKRAKMSPEKMSAGELDKTAKDNKTANVESDETLKEESDDIIILESDEDVKKTSAANDKKDNLPSAPTKEVKKIEFTKLSSTLEKNISATFPKIIFKSIDSTPHAVYQSDDKKKLETFGLSHKYEATAVETKLDNDKLIIVLKKDVKSSDGSSDSKTSESSKVKIDTEKSDFHLTRRKRLLARNDCNVYELKCLICKTQFMSLKTLYFHMLSLHSKKRLYYPCPFCKTLFVQMYGVTRHLVSIHNKTKDQINKLREVIKKKSVWKKIEDVNTTCDANISPINYQIRMSPPPETKVEPPKPEESESSSETEQTLKTVIKLGKNAVLHQCSKCSRVFGRKSSQVSHEKFCIMNNPVKMEERDTSSPPVQASAVSSSPVVSFLAPLPPPPSPKASVPLKPAASIVQFKQPAESIPAKPPAEEKPTKPVVKLSIRPKRGAEKRMHKDFVNSQTLKWRSANRVDTNANSKATSSTSTAAAAPTAPVKKGTGKNLEKKVLSIMNTKNLSCLKCDKKFSSYSNLRRHVAIHVGWTRFKCKFCDYQAYNKSQCWSHIQKAHSVDESDIEKAIVNLVNTNALPTKKTTSGEMQSSSTKYVADTSDKPSTSKALTIPKVKISKRKAMTSSKVIIPVKKLQAQKRDLPVEEENERQFEEEAVESKKDKPQPAVGLLQKIPKKEVVETKKEKLQTTITLAKLPKKEVEAKKEKLQTTIAIGKLPKKEVETKEKKLLTTIAIGNLPKKDVESKKEKSQHIIPIQKLTIPDYKRETNYKSVTTSNPTTIILSKKIPSSTVQSIVTISPDSVSSTSKISPIRTSPRKNEGVKGPGERLITTLVTRSSAYSKTTPIQIKLPGRSNSTEELSKDSPEKNCSKKERLISEWFPKKDLSSSSVRRDSAPLIIGLVPARAKSTSSVEEEKTSP